MNIPITYLFTPESVINRFQLEKYARRLFDSPARKNPYHNIRHMLHVLLECMEASFFEKISKEKVRPLLIAGMLHDLDHPGIRRPDSENISETLAAVRDCMHEDKEELVQEVCRLIPYTQFPYLDLPECPLGNIIRDADFSQAFIGHTAWINESLVGLSLEWNTDLTAEHIQKQISFIKSIAWRTRWAREKYGESVKRAKIQEYREWERILFSSD